MNSKKYDEKFFYSAMGALRAFAWHFHVNDCNERDDEGALEVPIYDLRQAHDVFVAAGGKIEP
jgi:hypothetical protein